MTKKNYVDVFVFCYCTSTEYTYNRQFGKCNYYNVLMKICDVEFMYGCMYLHELEPLCIKFAKVTIYHMAIKDRCPILA